MSLSIPIAFLIFNRPDLTEMVFRAIARAKPKKLLVVADGPRIPDEAEKCEKTRAVINQVDWDCEVLSNFSDKNMRGPWRISSGLDWVFSLVEEAIVLEDDCLPVPTFFGFCEELLERYRHDERVMHISGNNFQRSQGRTKYGYYFSRYTDTWGWASWRRAWKHFDLSMKTWPDFKAAGCFNDICDSPREREFWTTIFDKCVFQGDVHWDYAWMYACWSQSGLSLVPGVNLVTNVGFRGDATHTTCADHPWAYLPAQDIGKVGHPAFVARNRRADMLYFEEILKTEGKTPARFGRTRKCLSLLTRKLGLGKVF